MAAATARVALPSARRTAIPPTSSASPSSVACKERLSTSFLGLSLHHSARNDFPHAAAAGHVPPCGVSMAMEAGIGVLGNKLGMMTWFDDQGYAVPCTVIGFREGNIVTQVKTAETHGYNAVQVGYRRVAERKLTKPELGHLKKIDTIAMRHLQEFRLSDVSSYQPGQQLAMEELFKQGDIVDVSGTSIGKGFAGGIKRHNFARGPMTHGSKSHRQLGSIGPGTTPGRVYPGKKMPGQMGNEQVKIRKLTVLKVDPELHAMLVKGSVPGKPGGLVRITPAKIVGKNIPVA